MTETTSKTRKIQVEIEETLRWVVTVEVPDTPNSDNMAIAEVSKMYREEGIVLDSDDYVCTSFNIVNDKTKTE